MYRDVQIALLSVLGVLYGLSVLSRRFPHVAWLQLFRFEPPRMSEDQRAKARRQANVYGGVELIMVGIGLPMAYVAMTVMFFNDIAAIEMALVLTASALCIGLGITALWRSRRG
jgi:hypothetical protein